MLVAGKSQTAFRMKAASIGTILFLLFALFFMWQFSTSRSGFTPGFAEAWEAVCLLLLLFAITSFLCLPLAVAGLRVGKWTYTKKWHKVFRVYAKIVMVICATIAGFGVFLIVRYSMEWRSLIFPVGCMLIIAYEILERGLCAEHGYLKE